MKNIKRYSQKRRDKSPFSKKIRCAQLIWEIVWCILCEWTPKPFNKWRILVLRCFRARIYGNPFVHQRARIDHPWNLILRDKSCLGDRAHAYCLGSIEIDIGACVAQEVYICSASHDLHKESWPLITAPVYIGKNSFIGARAFIMPGISIGKNCIIGACTTVTKDLAAFTKVVGEQAREISSQTNLEKTGGKRANYDGFNKKQCDEV